MPRQNPLRSRHHWHLPSSSESGRSPLLHSLCLHTHTVDLVARSTSKSVSRLGNGTFSGWSNVSSNWLPAWDTQSSSSPTWLTSLTGSFQWPFIFSRCHFAYLVTTKSDDLSCSTWVERRSEAGNGCGSENYRPSTIYLPRLIFYISLSTYVAQ